MSPPTSQGRNNKKAARPYVVHTRRSHVHHTDLADRGDAEPGERDDEEVPVGRAELARDGYFLVVQSRDPLCATSLL